MKALIERKLILDRIGLALRRNRIAILLGPRQCGKTTVARMFTENLTDCSFFDLENPAHFNRLENPMLALEGLSGLAVIDEVQIQPKIFPVLRVLADRRPSPCKFLLLGSASPDLVQWGSESLAGRVEFIQMEGFSLAEAGNDLRDRLWLRGGFPESFLAADDIDSLAWRQNFVQSFLEKDIRRFGIEIAPIRLRRFWIMTAHVHGLAWNGVDIAASLGIAHSTCRRYLDRLTDTYMLFQIQPWHENIAKRQVKSPKIFIRDTGLLHALLGIGTADGLFSHPKLGFSWEGFVLQQLAAVIAPRNIWFWGTHAGAELDFFIQKSGRRIGVECKYADAPKITKSMRSAIESLRLDKLYIITPGRDSYALSETVEVHPVTGIEEILS